MARPLAFLVSLFSGERRRAKQRQAHRAAVLDWLRMDVNAEIASVRNRLKPQA
jgi:hypothetical protein